MALSGPGNRGLTRTAYTANPPLFRGGAVEPAGTSWVTHPPRSGSGRSTTRSTGRPGLHKLRSMGKGPSSST